MEALAVTSSFCAGNGRLFQQLGRALALAQIDFCGWQEHIGHRSTDQF
jgi:hypothetical protein